MKSIRTFLIVALPLLAGCAAQQPALKFESFMTTNDIQSLSQAEVEKRFLYTNRCLKAAESWTKARQFTVAKETLQDCNDRHNRDDHVALGKRMAQIHSDWPKVLRMSLERGLPFAIGMSKGQLKLTMGEPDDINRTMTASTTKEQWIYRFMSMYFYFTDDKLTAVQS